MKKSWSDVADSVFESVFYAYDREEVQASDDLRASGFLDSLALVTILEILIDASGSDDALAKARPEHFRNMDSIREFYRSL